MNRLSRFAMGLVGDDMAVADAASGQITLLNPSASIVWLTLLERDCAETDILTLFDGAVAHPQGEAILSILRNFEDLGWAYRTSDGAWQVKEACASSVEWTQIACGAGQTGGLLWNRQVHVSDAAILLQVASETGADSNGDFARVSSFLAGLPLDCCPQPNNRLSLVITAAGIEVHEAANKAIFKDVQTASGLFLRLAIRSLHPDAKPQTTLHAGAVCGPKGALLFPAISGSGKTTLTAYLSAKGWRYGGDDVVGIGRFGASNDIHLLPFPTALGLKDGSLDILRSHYPEIAYATPVAYGSKSVRFVVCDHELDLIPIDWRKIRALVFPTYDKDAGLHLEAISQADALRLILEAGWGDGLEFDPAEFDLLLAAVNNLPAYSLRYSSLEAAAGALESLP
jgi:hypothetical protein